MDDLDFLATGATADEIKIAHVDNANITRRYVFKALPGDVLLEFRRRSGLTGAQFNDTLYVFKECFLRLESDLPAEREKLAQATADNLLKLARAKSTYAIVLDRITNLYVIDSMPKIRVGPADPNE
jgi:hypothetical protein